MLWKQELNLIASQNDEQAAAETVAYVKLQGEATTAPLRMFETLVLSFCIMFPYIFLYLLTGLFHTPRMDADGPCLTGGGIEQSRAVATGSLKECFLLLHVRKSTMIGPGNPTC